MKRILVTGSRDWQFPLTVSNALWDAWIDLGREPLILIHGACPTGADAYADRYWKTTGYPVERHPADWSRGARGGPERNARMVAAGADLCLAFIRGKSRGATNTANLARAADIETKVFRA